MFFEKAEVVWSGLMLKRMVRNSYDLISRK